jgi:hypothetical protein
MKAATLLIMQVKIYSGMILWLIQCCSEQGVLLLLVSVFLFTLYWLSLGKERAIQHKLIQQADIELKNRILYQNKQHGRYIQ